MDGHDVLRDREELRPRVEPFLVEGETLQVILRASSRPAKAIKVAAIEAWPFFHEKDKFLLVATDRRWLVLESSKEKFQGDLSVRATFPREIKVETSWFTRFDGFDRPYSIDPIHQLWAVAANEALAAQQAGRTWDLESEAGGLTAEDNDRVTEALGELVMRAGRFVPRRRR